MGGKNMHFWNIHFFPLEKVELVWKTHAKGDGDKYKGYTFLKPIRHKHHFDISKNRYHCTLHPHKYQI